MQCGVALNKKSSQGELHSMSKKIIALSIMLLSILFMLISIETITGIGVIKGECTYYQTISPFGIYFDLSNSDEFHLIWIRIILYVLGLLLLYVPNFMMFELSKVRSIVLAVLNTTGIIMMFLYFKSYQYIFMMIVVCVLLAANLLIQFIVPQRSKVDLFVLLISAFISLANVYYLYRHFWLIDNKWIPWELNNVVNPLIKDMILISRINIICFVLWFIPYIILLVKEIRSEKSKAEKL